jgi:hypothetical protein
VDTFPVTACDEWCGEWQAKGALSEAQAQMDTLRKINMQLAMLRDDS